MASAKELVPPITAEEAGELSSKDLLKKYFSEVSLMNGLVSKSSSPGMKELSDITSKNVVALGSEIRSRAKNADATLIKDLTNYLEKEGYSNHHPFFLSCLCESKSPAALEAVEKALRKEFSLGINNLGINSNSILNGLERNPSKQALALLDSVRSSVNARNANTSILNQLDRTRSSIDSKLEAKRPRLAATPSE